MSAGHSVLLLVIILSTTRTNCVTFVRGKGASFPHEVYKNWMPAYQAYRSKHVNLDMTYDAVGSGSGKSAIKENINIEYAGSDSLLSATDMENFPDLVMFPTMAGGVILGYNVPEAKGSLRLTREHIVGIYNGTITQWNDLSIQDSNPGLIMPKRTIIVLARADKSGTTNLFTEALSIISSEWNKTYGTFSAGVNVTSDIPYHWDPNVIKYYGQRNRGMSGLILSLKYSVGYLSVADALPAQIHGANILNRAGYFVNASTTTVQSAMDDFSETSSSLTFSLADGHGSNSYPIAGFTYFIVYKTWVTRCDSAKEFVRYVDYFLNDQELRKRSENLGMAPLSPSLVNRIKEEILKTISCRGQNVWALVEKDIENESQVQENWVVPVAVSVPIFMLLVILVCGYLLRQRYKLMRMLDSNEWHIPIEDIIFVSENGKNSTNGSKFTGRSMASFYSAREHHHDDFLIQQILQWPGKWRGVQIGVRLMEVKQLRSLNKPMKQCMLSMKNRFCHNNIVRFFGLTDLDIDMYVVSEYCAKGTVADILQDGKLNLTNDLKCSLSLDIANGMQYLHANDITHGHLRSRVCLMDARWQVKISDWEYCKLLSVKREEQITMFQLHENLYSNLDAGEQRVNQFWVAPEMIKADFMLPVSKESDIYSFAITLQEIFSREEPYVEHADVLSPKEIVNAVLLNGLRPDYSDDTPMSIRQVMEICWNDNSISRPSFDQVIKLLRRANPQKKSIIDSMMATLEEYIDHLEGRIEENNAELKVTNDKLESTLSCLMPPYVALRVSKGKSAKAERHCKLAVAVVEIVTLDNDAKHLNPAEIITFLNEVYFEVELLAKRYSIFLQKACGCSFYLISGFEFAEQGVENMCTSFMNLCFDIVDHKEISELLHSMECPVHLRIGLHMDEAVTGMIGANAPSFIVFGSLIDVAQSLARSSQPSTIHVSHAVWKIAKSRKVFNGTSHGDLTIKERTFKTYLLTGRETNVCKAPSDDSGVGGEINQEKDVTNITQTCHSPKLHSRNQNNVKYYSQHEETKYPKGKKIHTKSNRKRNSIENNQLERNDEKQAMDSFSKSDSVEKYPVRNSGRTKSLPITKEYVPVKSKWKRTFVSSVYPHK